jgi:hypothetical protein
MINNYGLYIIIIAGISDEEASNLQLISTSVCPWGINMTFECTVNGTIGDTTVWTGTDFNGCDNNEISLLHINRFGNKGAYGTCNNGAITGQIVNVIMGTNSNRSIYTSQLIVTVRSENNLGKVIECFHDDGANVSLVGSINLTVNTSIICIRTTTSIYMGPAVKGNIYMS